MRWIIPPIAFTDLFQRVFGQDFESWFAGFARWQCEQVARNEWQSTVECGEAENSTSDDAETTATTRITGIVVGPGDVPIPWVPITACNEERTWCRAGRTVSGPDGTFDLLLHPSHRVLTPYLLVLELGEDCPRLYEAGEIPGKSATGTRYEVGPDGLADVRIEVPIDACGARITGTVRTSTGAPMYLTGVYASSRWGGNTSTVRTLDGRFWITVPHTTRGVPSQDVAWYIEFGLSQFLSSQFGIAFHQNGYIPAKPCNFAYAPATAEGYIYTGDGWTLSDGYFQVPAEGIDGLEIFVDTEVCAR